MSQFPGLPESLYIAGRMIALNPQGYSPQWSPVEVANTLADTSELIERPITLSGAVYLPTADRLRKFSCSLSWSAVNENDIDTLEDVDAHAWPFDFTDWRRRTEEFSGTAVLLSRRSALTHATVLPLGATSNYPTEVWVDNVADTGYSLGTPDSLGRTPMTLSLTPSGNPGCIRVRYVPLYLVRVVGADSGYPKGNVESRVLHLKEVA
jgi:hypothetical protein